MTTYTLSYARTLSFTGNYTRDFTTTRSPSYSRDFSGNYARHYSRTRTSAFTRDRDSVYSGTYSKSYTRERDVDYTRERDESFIGNYARSFTRERDTNFTRDRIVETSIGLFTTFYARILSYNTTYSRSYSRNYVTTRSVFYGGSYTRVCTRTSEVITCTVFTAPPPGFDEF